MGGSEARIDDVAATVASEAAFTPCLPSSSASKRRNPDPVAGKEGPDITSWNKLVNKPLDLHKASAGSKKLDQIPDDKRYTTSTVTPALGRKVMEAVSRLSWPYSGRCSIGWQSADQPIDPASDPELWRKITHLAAEMLDPYLKLNPLWTYSRITAAKGPQMKDLPIQGGVGGSVMWAWSKAGGVAAKVGFCHKFNAHNRLVEFHSRTPSNLFPGCEDSFALLFHKFDSGPFEVAEHRRILRSWGLAPDPIADKSDSEESSGTTVAEDEDNSPPTGLGQLRFSAAPNTYTPPRH